MINDKDTDEIFDLANSLWGSHQYVELKDLIDNLMDSNTISVELQTLRMYRAFIYERGLVGDVDVSAAYSDYSALYEASGSERALLGAYSTMADVFDDQLHTALEGLNSLTKNSDLAASAFFNLAKIYDSRFQDPYLAASNYWSSFYRGNVYALERLSDLEFRNNHPIRAATYRRLMTIIKPFYRILIGIADPHSGLTAAPRWLKKFGRFKPL